ncbi:RHS repeat-associated core domain-containing protein [bacterium]|nr:RHS repeat-associated core domain-containing protein [bacterium]
MCLTSRVLERQKGIKVRTQIGPSTRRYTEKQRGNLLAVQTVELSLTDRERTVVWRGEYYPYGELYSEYVSASNELRFPGQWHDRESGLHYNWHRYYDPSTGRYLQADPMGLAGGMNLYGYAGANPISNIDPEGLDWLPLLNSVVTKVTGAVEFAYQFDPLTRYNSYVLSKIIPLIPESILRGPFTGFGEEATDYWACKYNKSYGFEAFLNFWPGFFASLWTEDTWFGTASTLAAANIGQRPIGVPRRYWQYYPEGNLNYSSPWVAGSYGAKPPYSLGTPARQALNLPPYNPGTAVRAVRVRCYEPIRGPRIPKPRADFGWSRQGTGLEYYRGWTWPRQ